MRLRAIVDGDERNAEQLILQVRPLGSLEALIGDEDDFDAWTASSVVIV